MDPELHLTWTHFLLIGTVTSVILATMSAEQRTRVKHQNRQGGEIISRPGLLYLAVVLLVDMLAWTLAANTAYLTVTHLPEGIYYPYRTALCCAALFSTHRLFRRGLTQQVISTPEGLYVEQWNHSIYLPWDATEGQWNLTAGRFPFHGVIQRRGSAPLLLRRYRLSVCLTEETTTRSPRKLSTPGPVIDVTPRN